jgi:6-phosphogluconolactonase (cycloisomerase 2 family)
MFDELKVPVGVPRTDRRQAVGRILTLAGAVALSACANGRSSQGASRSVRFVYVGSRTTKERNARGEGIQVYRVEPTGEWTHVQLVKGLVNPSFLAFDKRKQYLYAVHGDMSEITSFGIAPTGELKQLNQRPTEGRNPVHLVVDETNRFVVVANYATGSLAVLPRNDDGTLGAVQQLENLPGTPGPHRVDQGSSHPHHIVYDRKQQMLLVPDKGLDRIFTFHFDAAAGKLVAATPGFVQVRPGAGPRHVVFHPTAPLVFVAHELDSSVGAYRYDSERGALTALQVVPSIPDTYTGANSAAEIDIAPSGRFVFVSNRGHDSIGTFKVDTASGKLTPVAWIPSEGKGPRFFALDPAGSTLFVANENSDTIVPFRIDAETGTLRQAGQIVRTGSPVCIVFSTT